MTRRRLRPEEIEGILAGSVPDSDPELGPLSEVVADLRRVYARPPAPETAGRHLRAIAEERRGSTRVVTTQRRPKLSLLAHLGTRVAGAAVAAFVLAAASLTVGGSLPDGAQHAVSSAAKRVGLDLPAPASGPEDRPPAHAEENRARAKAFTDAKRAWTACVAEMAPEHGGPEPFDPEQACGPKPRPHDFRGEGARGRPDHAGPKDKERGQGAGPPDHAGPKDKERGEGGPPDHAGPKDKERGQGGPPEHAGPRR